MSADIYETREGSGRNRSRRSAVSQRRDEYLQAGGGEPVLHRRHRHHHRKSSGRKAAILYTFLSLSALALLAAGALWWLKGKR